MSRRKAPPWSEPELEILRTIYPTQGAIAAVALLPGRTPGAVMVHANKLGIRCDRATITVRKGLFRDLAERAIALRDQGFSLAVIGAELGVCEATATNAVCYAECLRQGHRPAERGPNGKLLPEGFERCRLMLRKGYPHRDIMVRLGLTAATISHTRKKYEAELKARGLAPLPPTGGGLRYSGAKIPKAVHRRIEQLYLEGFGTKKITILTKASNTHCLRTRTRLIARLKRKGQCLPGCDIAGVRRKMKDSAAHVPQVSIDRLKKALVAGATVPWAARFAIMGECSAWKLAHRWLDAGEVPDFRKGPMTEAQREALPLPYVPGGRPSIFAYRKYIISGLPHDAAVAAVQQERRDARTRQFEDSKVVPITRTFEEQLERFAQGKGTLERNFIPSAELTFTPGGISSAAL